ncbi:MAG: hypothetical protein R6U84_08775 [Candidatus Cloacimonadales bacterium]
MKKIILALIMLGLGLMLLAENPTQDEKNKMFMTRLDQNLTELSKVISAYNEIQQNMANVKNVEYFNDFLYNRILDLGKVRKLVIESEEMDAENRATAVSSVLMSINSIDNYDFEQKITAEQDIENRQFLTEISEIFHQRLIYTRKKKLELENKIAETLELPAIYMDMLSQEFVYAYAISFMDISSYLSRNDRDFLVNIIDDLIDKIDAKNVRDN